MFSVQYFIHIIHTNSTRCGQCIVFVMKSNRLNKQTIRLHIYTYMPMHASYYFSKMYFLTFRIWQYNIFDTTVEKVNTIEWSMKSEIGSHQTGVSGMAYQNHQKRNYLLHSVFINDNIIAPFNWTFVIGIYRWPVTLQWRHNGHDSVSNHQAHDCLLNRLFRRRSTKTSKLRLTGICAGNSPGTGEFPAQMASYAEMFPFDDVTMDSHYKCQ